MYMYVTLQQLLRGCNPSQNVATIIPIYKNIHLHNSPYLIPIIRYTLYRAIVHNNHGLL